MEEKSPRVALLLSLLFCGVGHIYAGEKRKGIILIILYAISLAAMAGWFGFFTTPILLVWGMVDAYRTTERLNHQRALTTPPPSAP